MQKRQFQDVGMKLDSSTMLMLDLTDFWAESGWLAGLLILVPSLLLTVTLGILLRRQARAG